MNQKVFEGKWNQLKGRVQAEWGEITSDELDQIDGRRQQVVGLLQEKYGYAQQRAEREFDDFLDSMDDDEEDSTH
jgi:uncharacterized protein YjbJ (UPF0337 family)